MAKRKSPVIVSNDQILEVISTSDSFSTAAARLSLSPSSLHRRMATPAFQRQYEEFKERAMRQAADKLNFAACTAIDVLIDLAQNSTSEAVRCGAAKTILTESTVFNMQTSLLNRLHALEDAAEYVTVKENEKFHGGGATT